MRKRAKANYELTDHIQRNIQISQLCLAADNLMVLSDFESGILNSAITHNYSIKLAEEALSGDADALTRLLKSERIIAVMTGVSETHKKYTGIKRAENARKKRAESPEELALNAAIIAECGDQISNHPWKDAGAALKDINRRLKAGGFSAVKQGQIYYRLKKIP